MANMSYCRFENTLGDLEDCLEALRNEEIKSKREKEKAKTLLVMMADFLTEEDIISIDEEGYIEIDNDRIDKIINECC